MPRPFFDSVPPPPITPAAAIVRPVVTSQTWAAPSINAQLRARSWVAALMLIPEVPSVSVRDKVPLIVTKPPGFVI